MGQVIEDLYSKPKALSLNPSTSKKNCNKIIICISYNCILKLSSQFT
jgi:hypothetical protein